MKRTLVLNLDYSPLAIIPSTRAFVLYYKDRATIVENYNEYFRTVNDRYPIPSIIRITEYAKFWRGSVPFTKRNIFKRDGDECMYCGSTSNLTIDHIIPTSKGGKDVWENVVTACAACNGTKADLMPEELPEKFKDISKRYRPHFLLIMQNEIKNIPDDWKPYLFLS